MRILCALLCFALTLASRAAEWRNDVFGCSANLPDTAGWVPIDAPSTPTLTVLAAMQNAQKQAVFGINVLHDLPNANLTDPGTLAKIESNLRGLGYTFFGRAVVNVGGRAWVQFPVRGGNPPTSGLIRYTSANNQVYVVSLLRGGGQEAAQDPDLLAAAASVQIGAPQAVAATPPASTPSGAPPVAPGTAAPSATPGAQPTSATPAEKTETEPADAPIKIGSITLTKDLIRVAIYVLVGLVVLMILMRIIGSGNKDRS